MIVPKEREAIPPRPVQFSKLLLVEGDTPTHFFEALAKHLKIDKQIEIRNYGGITQLGVYLSLLATTAEFRVKVTSLGIVRDAEENAAAALSSAKAAVASAALPKTVTVAYHILPDNTSPGMIETLCIKAVAGEKVFLCVDKFIECADSCGVELPQGPILAKHKAQVYLATQKKTQMMPGIASYHGAWQLDHDAFRDVKAFLQGL